MKTDGINLTPDGEKALIELVADEALTPQGAKRIKDQQNAHVLMSETDPGQVGDAVAEIDAELKETHGHLQTFTGDEAAEIGRRVEDAGQGNLGDES